MRDRDIVAAVVASDPAGLAAAYDNYASVLYNYCRSLLAEPADAADAVQDTFVIAAAKLAGLRDPDRLRPWLYAVARNECHRRLRARARFASLDEAGDVTDSGETEPRSPDAASLKELVTAAVGGLNPGDREVIELNLRHDLTGGDLADALGVPPNQAHALASRARSQLERSLGALLVARTGRQSCAELNGILAGWDGNLTILLRKRISRHVENCETCAERKRRELSPAMLLSVLPIFAVPRGLRQQVLRLVSDSTPDAASYRAAVVQRAGQFSPAGFPVQVSRVGPGGGLRSRAVALGAAAALIIAAGGGGTAAYFLTHHRHLDKRAGPTVTVTITAPPSAPVVPAVGTPAPTISSSATSPSSAQSPPSTSAPPSAPAAQPTPTASPGTLGVSPSVIQLRLSPLGVAYTGSFTITAAGGPVSYSISVPTSEAYLSLSAMTGNLKAGGSLVVSVTGLLNPTTPPTNYNTLTINPGGITVVVYYPPGS